MLNYIKSELYRAGHSKEIHGAAMGLLGMIFFMNLILGLMKRLEHFRYGITSFSYSMVVSMPMLYCYVAFCVAIMLYEGDRRNGTLGNSVSYGLSRLEIFLGKCTVAFVTSLALLALALPVYIGSAVLLLDNAGPTTVREFLTEIPAVSLVALAALCFGVLLLETCDKLLHGMLLWLAVMVFLPKILLLAGLYFSDTSETLLNIALWLPVNFFSQGVQVNMSQCSVLWSTPEGMGRCLIAGGTGILVIGVMAVLALRKKEV